MAVAFNTISLDISSPVLPSVEIPSFLAVAFSVSSAPCAAGVEGEVKGVEGEVKEVEDDFGADKGASSVPEISFEAVSISLFACPTALAS